MRHQGFPQISKYFHLLASFYSLFGVTVSSYEYYAWRHFKNLHIVDRKTLIITYREFLTDYRLTVIIA